MSIVEWGEELRGFAEERSTLEGKEYICELLNEKRHVTDRRTTSKRVERSRQSFKKVPLKGSPEKDVWFKDSKVLAAS